MRLLVVEDELNLADALAAGLRRDGYAVDVANDGESARAALAVDRYDLVTLDLTLPPPGPDGAEVCRQVRAGLLGPRETRVLMVTARDAVSERVGGLDNGADDYLVKPFALDELRARVRCLLRRPATHGTATITVGPLTIDTASQRAMCARRNIELSPKEFAVLRYLATHFDTVVSQEDLLEHVWDRNADSFTETVRVTVGTLRRKLRTHLDPVPIETVVGSGYRLHEVR